MTERKRELQQVYLESDWYIPKDDPFFAGFIEEWNRRIITYKGEQMPKAPTTHRFIMENAVETHETIYAEGKQSVMYRYRVFQRRPYTMVWLWRGKETQGISGFGFSKVCYPDTWDANAGIQIALAKAAGDYMAKRAAEGYSAETA